MISTAGSVALTGAVVAGANLLADKRVSPRQLIGWGVYAVIMAGFNEADSKVAEGFAMIVLIGVLFVHLPKLTSGLGLSK